MPNWVTNKIFSTPEVIHSMLNEEDRIDFEVVIPCPSPIHNGSDRIEAWGTSRNACEQSHDVNAGSAEFETAWSHPDRLVIALSKRFPSTQIAVQYADEDIGLNCGVYLIKNGEIEGHDIAPALRDQSSEERKKWIRFACLVKGWDANEYLAGQAD